MIILSRLFFSTARRTNQEAPPQLSGFWVCRRSRRRGLRNSLRSDSPRPFSSVSLATSPPDKGGIGGSCLYSNPFSITFTEGIFNPSVLRTPPLYFAVQNAGEEGESNLPLIAVQYSAYGARQGEKVILDFVTATADIFLTPPSLRTPPLYFAMQNTP